MNEENKDRLKWAIEEAIRKLEDAKLELPNSIEAAYQVIPDTTDNLLDVLYEIFRSLNTNPQNLFPPSKLPPPLYSEERNRLLDAASQIQDSGNRMLSLISDSNELQRQRQKGRNSEITAQMKLILINLCSISDFVFPTHDKINAEVLNLQFRIIINNDMEYIIE